MPADLPVRLCGRDVLQFRQVVVALNDVIDFIILEIVLPKAAGGIRGDLHDHDVGFFRQFFFNYV